LRPFAYKILIDEGRITKNEGRIKFLEDDEVKIQKIPSEFLKAVSFLFSHGVVVILPKFFIC